MENGRRLLYESGLFVVGILWFGVVVALTFSHLRIGELEPIRDELTRRLSHREYTEYLQLRDVRRVSAAGAVVLTGAVLVMSNGYVRQQSEPRREAKKTLLSGGVLFPLGLGLYRFTQTTIVESVGLAIVALTVLGIVDSLLLLQLLSGTESSQ